MDEIILIGAGSQAKAIISAARAAGVEVRAIFADDDRHGMQSLLGVPFRGSVAHARDAGLPAILGFDDPRDRIAAARLDLRWATIVHPAAFLNPSATIGAGTVVLEGAVIQPSVNIGQHVLISANATVAHDCTIDDFAYLWPGVDLAGGVHIGFAACIAVGAVVIPNVQVGAWTTIGPRAAVIRDLPDNVRVDGLPARPRSESDDPSSDDPWPGNSAALAIGGFFLGLAEAVSQAAGNAGSWLHLATASDAKHRMERLAQAGQKPKQAST